MGRAWGRSKHQHGPAGLQAMGEAHWEQVVCMVGRVRLEWEFYVPIHDGEAVMDGAPEVGWLGEERTSNCKGNDEIRGFFAALRMIRFGGGEAGRGVEVFGETLEDGAGWAGCGCEGEQL